MARYIVQPILGLRGVPYYVVTDTSTGKGLEGYGCDTWAQHRADELNKKSKDSRGRVEVDGQVLKRTACKQP